MTDLDALPRTAAEARALGLKHYYPGQPCRNGHESPRYSHVASGAYTGNCVECTVLKGRANVEADRVARSAVRPLVLLGADWSVRVAGGTLDDVWRLAVASKEQRVEE